MPSMPSQFETVAKWGARWLGVEAWTSHTVDDAASARLVAGYLRFLDKIVGLKKGKLLTIGPAIDLGCGAGFIAHAFKQHGFAISATEYGADTVAFARSKQPDIEIRDADLSHFIEPGKYGLIFTREVYLFTRSNDYAQQHRVLSNLVDSLRPGGVLLLAASDRSKPDCLDFARAIEAFRTDRRIALVSQPHVEPILKRFHAWIFGSRSYRFITLLLAPYIALRKRRHAWAPSLVVAFVRSK